MSRDGFSLPDALAVEETVARLFLLLFLMPFKFPPSTGLQNQPCCVGSSSQERPQGVRDIFFYFLAREEVG